MAYIIMAIVLLHFIVGFGYFIWKLEIQGKKKKDSKDQIEN
jgi:hypothetical protein